MNLRTGRWPTRSGLLPSPPMPTETPTYTLAMVAADTLRRVGTRLRAITASRKASPVPRVMVISNVGSFGGGGALGFRDMVLAIREKRPDLDVVAVCPWKGSLAAECARHDVRTKITFIPGWAFLATVTHATHRGAHRRDSRWRASPFRHLASSVATYSTTPDDGAHQHDGHSRARDRCQTARHPALLDGPRVRKRRPSASVPVGPPPDHPPDRPAVGVGDLQFTRSGEGSARSRSEHDDVTWSTRSSTPHSARRRSATRASPCEPCWSVTSLKPRDNTLPSRL